MTHWTPPDWLMNTGVIVAALSLIALIIRMIGPWRKQLDELEEKLRGELRVERDRCDAELRLVKHRERRSRQMIYSLLHLFDLPATRRKETLINIRNELAVIEQAEAAESAIVSTGGNRETEG
jgi:hypothetical protein